MPQDELAQKGQLQAHCEADFRAIVAQDPTMCLSVAHTRFSMYVNICQQILKTSTEEEHMPAKDYRTLGEDLINVAVRLPQSVIDQVDAHIDTLRSGARWAKVGRSDALRDLVLRGLESIKTPSLPPHADTQQPAIPLALEPAPKAMLRPTEPQADASQETQPSLPLCTDTPQAAISLVVEPAPMAEPLVAKTPAHHGRPGISRETLQAIADERTLCEGLSLRELAQRLHDKGIYSATAKDGRIVPVDHSRLSRWLKQAKEEELL